MLLRAALFGGMVLVLAACGGRPKLQAAGGAGQGGDGVGSTAIGGASVDGGSVVCSIVDEVSSDDAGVADGPATCEGLDGDAADTGDAGIADDVPLKAIAAGSGYACGLTVTGNVRCWGRIYSYKYPTGAVTLAFPGVSILSNVRGIATGQQLWCALTTSGDVQCGDATNLNLNLVLTGAKAIAIGAMHACALTAQGSVRCWGVGHYGQLGNGTYSANCGGSSCATRAVTRYPPTGDVLTCVRGLTLGQQHTCALMMDGGVRCWGRNSDGQLGDGTTTDRSTPPLSNVISDVKAIAAGDNHTCVLTNSGNVRCWGNNSAGQLGDGTTTNRLVPAGDVLSDVRAVVAGAMHTCALTNSGGVRCWGRNTYGELGDATVTGRSRPPGNDPYGLFGDGMDVFRSAPTSKDVLSHVQAIAAGNGFTCALMNDGGAKCWGNNASGEVNHTWAPAEPLTLDVLTGARAVTAGKDQTCAIMKTGGLRCWGSNEKGVLGNGTTTDLYGAPATDLWPGADGTMSVDTGGQLTCSIGAWGGGLYCWGGTAGARVPNRYEGYILDSVQSVAVGNSHECAALDTGEVKCWADDSGDKVPNATLTGIKSLAAGEDFTCGITTTGGVRCWGSNLFGQLGIGTTGGTSQPPQSDVLTGAQKIAAGANHVCVLMNIGGGVRCWGNNANGQLGDGTTVGKSVPPETDVLDGVQSVTAGASHTCALMSAGGVRCWGSNAYGQLGTSAPGDVLTPSDTDILTGVQGVSAGDNHTCALMSTGTVRCWGSNTHGQLGTEGHLFSLVPVSVDGTCH